ncbi:glycosyl hydrolase family 8 [Salinicola lusitanus]|uniref:cellulase n=1 Tax=Salinicola lusitanus TaxID=1949085 RepID=A0ABZ3CMJ5_9GAMM
MPLLRTGMESRGDTWHFAMAVPERWQFLSGRLRQGLWIMVMLAMSATAWAQPFFSRGDAGWESYKSHFLLPEGRIIDTANGNVSHTEGQGWGMYLAVQFQDRETFDRLWQWTEAHLAREDVALYSWRYDPASTPPVADINNASDGDLFIAWALQLAADRWDDPRYRARADQILDAVQDDLIVEVAGYRILLPAMQGFRHPGYVNINLSYWVLPALRDFAAREPAGPWQSLIDSGARLLTLARFGDHDLPADWLRLSDSARLAPAEKWPPRFGFENVRVPLYFTWGNRRDVDTLEEIARFWDTPLPPAWIDVTTGEVAGYPLSEGGMAINALLAGKPWEIPQQSAAGENYYSATLLMLARVAANQLSLSGSYP